MSDLTALRDHCRRMSRPDDDGQALAPGERALFEQIADEIDAYLHIDTTPPTPTGPDLFSGQG